MKNSENSQTRKLLEDKKETNILRLRYKTT